MGDSEVNVRALQLQVNGQPDEVVTPRLIKWLVIAIVIVMPYQVVRLPVLQWGDIVDIVILLLLVVGWGIIWWERRPVRFPLFIPFVLIVVGSLLGTMGGLDRGEALSTLARDIYVWMLFYTVVNLVRGQKFLHTVVRVWVVVAVLQSGLIIWASTATAGRESHRVRGLADKQVLQALEVPSLAEMPSEYKQAMNVVKRKQISSYGPFTPGGASPGTFANHDFAASYLGQSFFLALVMPLERRRWLRLVAAGLIFYAAFSTGVSAVAVVPVALGLYILLISSPRMRLFLVVAAALAISLALLFLQVTPYLVESDLFETLELSKSRAIADLEAGLKDRGQLLGESWREFRERPLGLGPHGLRASDVEKNVHNEYMAYLVERGFLGLTGLLLMYLMFAATALTSMWRGDRAHRVLMAGLIAAFTVQVLFDLAHEILRQRYVWMLLILMFIYADLERHRSQAQRQATMARQWPWAYPDHKLRPDSFPKMLF